MKSGPQGYIEEPPSMILDSGIVTLQFPDGEIQSRMLSSDPNQLLISYTQAMMAFRLFQPMPKRITMIGLGGGSMAKWCYHHLPDAYITVVEIHPGVIALRDQFYVPEDNERFHVVCYDGADYVAHNHDSATVLLIDGFDMHGQPPQLCSQRFYDDCYKVLHCDGVFVANLCGPDDEQVLERIRNSFAGRTLVVIPQDSENKVVFAWKGKRLWADEEESEEIMKKHMVDIMQIPSLVSR
jgi:spermidine synthase